MSANDQALLQQWVHDRDAEAFRMLAMRHAAMVYSTSRRILRDPTDAEDVAQECFEALVRAGDKPGAYLGHGFTVSQPISPSPASKPSGTGRTGKTALPQVPRPQPSRMTKISTPTWTKQ